ncbi:MAG: hypothetical protein K5770_00305 [Lachnospiraceae bacterium]|nr:hypothetical protein [Lachnospiraceae bacterium]
MKKKIFSGIILSLAMVFGSMPGMTMTAKAAETVVIGSDTKRWEQGNTYVLNNDVTIPDRIAVSGEATLKLNEGHTLTASAGITVPPGAKLTIEGPGTLEAYAGQGQWFNAGIGG